VKDPKQKRSLDEIEKVLDEDAAFEEADEAVSKMSDEEVDREVAAAGIDVEKMKRKVLAGPPAAARPPRRVPVMSAWLVAAALALLVAGAMALAIASRDELGHEKVAKPARQDAGEDTGAEPPPPP
jgi:hypothetical protein